MISLPVEHPKGKGWIIFEFFEHNGETVCGIYDLRGRLDLPPKAWLRVVRATVAEFEQRMKAAGVAELRLCGRDWSRILPDFEPNPAVPNGLRKRL